MKRTSNQHLRHIFTKIVGKCVFVISSPDLVSKIPLYVSPKVGDLQIFKSVSNFTAGLCIWIPFFHFESGLSSPLVRELHRTGLQGWSAAGSEIQDREISNLFS